MFLRRALTEQTTIGAIAPSSRVLARHMAQVIPPYAGMRILELGAGNGAISAAIGARLAENSQHFAVERDPELLAELADRAPWATRIHGDAAELVRHLDALGARPVDVTLSVLPWSYFTADLQRRILSQISSVLVPQGIFATVAYCTAPLNSRYQQFRELLETTFAHIEVSRMIWANLPPARIIVCRGPIAG